MPPTQRNLKMDISETWNRWLMDLLLNLECVEIWGISFMWCVPYLSHTLLFIVVWHFLIHVLSDVCISCDRSWRQCYQTTVWSCTINVWLADEPHVAVLLGRIFLHLHCVDFLVLWAQAKYTFLCKCRKASLVPSSRNLLQNIVLNCWGEGKRWCLGKVANGSVMDWLFFHSHTISLVTGISKILGHASISAISL